MKLGRRKPSNTPAILFKDILRTVPKHPVSEDYLSDMAGWEMLGNDTYGDCVAVAWANARRFFTSKLGGVEKYPTLQQVYKLYKTQNPGFPAEDDGMDIQTMLNYIRKKGGPDGVKPIAFAKVNTASLTEIKAAVYIFGGLILGIDVQSRNMDDFDAGKPWTYRKTDSIDGGHGVFAGGYLGKSGNDIRFITWAQETGLTDTFWKNLVNIPDGEAWCVIWPENLGTRQFVEGIDMAKLAADFLSLTGTVLSIG